MSGDRFYVGLAATIHDPAVAIVNADGEVVFAEALERPLQEKRAWNQPPDAMGHIASVIREHCGPQPELVASVNWSRRLNNRLRLLNVAEMPLFAPWLGRVVEAAIATRDHEVWPLDGYWMLLQSLRNSLVQAGLNLQWQRLTPAGYRLRGFDHHLTHAVTAAVSSPFDDAVCAVVDGFGEGTSTAFFRYRGGRVDHLARPGRRRTGSLGMFYALLCHLCGFDPILGEEWKVMGLAPYGEEDPRYYELLRPLLKVEGLELKQGVSPSEYRAHIGKLQTLMRPADAPPVAAADLARTGQEVFCEVMRELLHNLHAAGGSDNLMMAGGCALNSAWNGRILRETPFRQLSVPSAPADDGCAIGAAHLARLEDQPGATLPPDPCGFALGTPVCRATLDRLHEYGHLPGIAVVRGDVPRRVAQILSEGGIVAWMQGRAEFGPRALGHRSILADPRPTNMKARINREVKMREGFRPFAPAVLHEFGQDWFEDYTSAPHMERTFLFRQDRRAQLPAVEHVDGTGRVQSVHWEFSPHYHAVLTEFHRLTGVPIILNTSLNRMGKPIVHAIEDALGLFLTTGIDALAIEDTLLLKRESARE